MQRQSGRWRLTSCPQTRSQVALPFRLRLEFAAVQPSRPRLGEAWGCRRARRPKSGAAPRFWPQDNLFAHWGSSKMGSISTRLTERFGCRHPFASAGMAFAGSTADLALGVCAGGGIGAIGVGFTPAEQLRAIIHQIGAATGAPFNVNFITCFDNDAQIRVCAEEKVPIAS